MRKASSIVIIILIGVLLIPSEVFAQNKLEVVGNAHITGRLQFNSTCCTSGEYLTNTASNISIYTANNLRLRVNNNGTVRMFQVNTTTTDPELITRESDGTLTKISPDNMIIKYFISLPNGIQTLLDAGELPVNIINSGADTSAFIGLNYAGGIIFYMENDGAGMVAAPIDQSNSAKWGCAETDLSSVPNVPNPPSGSGAEIGDGSINTSAILSVGNCPTAPAALACTNYMGGGYSDWFLPSINELDEMYKNIGQGAAAPNTNIGNFADLWYWSSSEFDASNAWDQSFSLGVQSSDYKDFDVRVRAIRAF